MVDGERDLGEVFVPVESDDDVIVEISELGVLEEGDVFFEVAVLAGAFEVGFRAA